MWANEKRTYLLGHNGPCGGMLNFFNTPSVPLPKLLDILQILILQILSKIRKLLRKRAMIRFRRRGRRWGRRRQAVRDGQQGSVMIVGCGIDFWCFESHRGRSLLSRSLLGLNDRWRGHRRRGIGSGFELEGFKIPFLAYWGGHDYGAVTEGTGRGEPDEMRIRPLLNSWEITIPRERGGKGEDVEVSQVINWSADRILAGARDSYRLWRALGTYPAHSIGLKRLNSNELPSE